LLDCQHEIIWVVRVEEKCNVDAKIGQVILVIQEGRTPLYNMLSDQERRLFTTKPKEVTA